jgi:hypothetical protein
VSSTLPAASEEKGTKGGREYALVERPGGRFARRFIRRPARLHRGTSSLSFAGIGIGPSHPIGCDLPLAGLPSSSTPSTTCLMQKIRWKTPGTLFGVWLLGHRHDHKRALETSQADRPQQAAQDDRTGPMKAV